MYPVSGATAAWIAMVSMALLASAADTPLNTTVAQDQEKQAVTVLTNGTVVAVWEDESIANGRILLRRFAPNLSPLGSEQQVDLSGGAERREPAIAALNNGGFVVAYSALGIDGSSYAVVFRRYNSNGTALDPGEVQANTLSTAAQFRPQVAPLGSGGFVLCWSGQSGGAGQDVFMRRYDSSGTPLDPGDVSVNTLGNAPLGTGDQGSARIAALADGGYIIVFEDRSSANIFAVRFTSSGTAVGVPGKPESVKQWLLTPSTPYDQTAPAVAGLTNGGFVVAYNTETNGTALSRRVFARVYSSTGVGGAEFQIGDHTRRWQDARLCGLPNGNFGVVWQARITEHSTNSWDIFAQTFNQVGTPTMPPMKVNAFDVGHQDAPCVSGLKDNGLVLAWQSNAQDGNGLGVFGSSTVLTPGLLTIAKVPTASDVIVQFVGTAGRQHELFASSNLLSWTSVLVTNPSAGAFEYVEPHSQARRLYRVESR